MSDTIKTCADGKNRVPTAYYVCRKRLKTGGKALRAYRARQPVPYRRIPNASYWSRC